MADVTNPTNDKARFCPACGGADVKVSPLAGGDAACNICNWKGKVEDLATFHFSHDMGSPDQIFAHFFNDMRAVLTAHLATAVGGVLMKWGFLDTPIDKKVFARYLGGAAKAVCESIIKTRQDLERERVKKST